MSIATSSTQVQPRVGLGARALYPVRELWYLPDAINEAVDMADAWQETAYVYEASQFDGERNWLVYNVTTATGIREMGIDPTRVVTCRWPEPVDVVVSR